MNMFKLLIACFGFLLFIAGCSDSTKITGTSEEPNEIAENESSSSAGPETISSSSSEKVKSSSSKDVETMSSSSSEAHVSPDDGNSSALIVNSSSSSSSEKDTQTTSSSSDKENSSSSDIPVESSSSSVESSSSLEPPTFDNSSSSSRPGTADGVAPNTFGYYISAFALDSAAFDSTVMASAIVYEEPPSASLPTSSSSTPKQFREPGLHQFTKDNIDTLKLKFPVAVRKYKDLITAIENGSAECNLYLYNVQGSAQTAGHTLANVTPDSVTVLDIVSENCNPTAEEIFGFLFTFCGEMNSEPELVRIAVESDIPANKCPNGRVSEWIKEN